MLPYLPTAVHVLLHVTADCQDLCDVMALLNQLMLRYKASLQDLLTEVCLTLIWALVVTLIVAIPWGEANRKGKEN